MKIFKLCTCFAVLLALLAGCGANGTETAEYSESSGTTAQTETESISAKAAYEKFLSGDISLFTEEDVSMWGLDDWKSALVLGGLQYVYLDIDGDGAEELLVQYSGVPAVFNGVFDYDGKNLLCRQYDMSDGDSFAFPLEDGSMVRQHLFNGTHSYTFFRYGEDGEITELKNLFARVELIPEDSGEPCPYYEIDGNEVVLEEFTAALKENVTDKMLDPSAWTEIQSTVAFGEDIRNK
ncbi:MAG: hypothetical protein K2H90_05525 [Oscillospiraceae bacterium]|nr:hypothetical protein [Oscillospiraceae bacterium]